MTPAITVSQSADASKLGLLPARLILGRFGPTTLVSSVRTLEDRLRKLRDFEIQGTAQDSCRVYRLYFQVILK
jgi:hypothetical protein